MKGYLFIESRDPLLASSQMTKDLETAANVAAQGQNVSVMLVQNSVLALRMPEYQSVLGNLKKSGARIFTDEFSLQTRGIHADVAGKQSSVEDLDLVIDRLADGDKVVWN